MYLGRIVAIGMSPSGSNLSMYRVSSRSFPNREARQLGEVIAIMPKPGFESDLSKNPYIAYNCARYTDDYVLTSNGSHTDPIIEKIAAGMPVRDAMAVGLLAMDYEKDDYNTPRIVAAVSRHEAVGYLGVVRHDALLVQEYELKPGVAHFVSTYEKNMLCPHNIDEAFKAETAAEACEHVIRGGVFADFDNPVTGVAARVNGDAIEFATADA